MREGYCVDSVLTVSAITHLCFEVRYFVLAFTNHGLKQINVIVVNFDRLNLCMAFYNLITFITKV